MKGIDISYYQGIIDFEKVKNDKVDFIMIKATEGKSIVDSMFENNINGAVRAGIPCGAYHYCKAKSTEEAVQEANFYLSVIKKYKFHYPIALDLEDESLLSLGKKTLTDIAIAFMETVKQNGFYPMLYTNPNWIVNYLEFDRLSSYDIWLAQWGVSAPSYKCGIWQKTATGRIEGIPEIVDLNEGFVDYKEYIESLGLNKTEDAEEEKPFNIGDKVTVKSGAVFTNGAIPYPFVFDTVFTVLEAKSVSSLIGLSGQPTGWMENKYLAAANEQEVYLTVSTNALPLALNSGFNGSVATRPILAWMPKGSRVKLLQKMNSKWYKILYNGREGYASSEYLK